MGLEQTVTLKKGAKAFQGKLHLDSKQLEFRSKTIKWAAVLTDLEASVERGRLVVRHGREKLVFDPNAPQKWVDKILNPPTLMTKLGIKAGQRCFVSPGFSKAFKDELRSSGAKIVRKFESADLVFVRIDDSDDLDVFTDVALSLEAGINLWAVWPKGNKAIGQSDVMKRARSLGMGPSKTAAIDDDLSSMRFAKPKKAKPGK